MIKAKSRAEANRKWKSITGDSYGIFKADYTSETGNKKEIELCGEYGEIIGDLFHSKQNFVSLKKLVDEKRR